ncbi:unnamed protein product (macronuclear) [Paramecium tetraurelia]|uniref:Uncharacterized protein n=1 Tax=Paramecium tetraurelia TaxID=5888 RepID=A0CT69_PARTE|nr:uncharacterized protein GSPATT00010220001 [Paramecium tetraurelia]CAK73986.1 unnamed protein product [Paramecium tetraurelia]|eukprot:XP_001441383.1 hypothetical protein (macronuclear) [Paramecium tetraurelia strain d4-2]
MGSGQGKTRIKNCLTGLDYLQNLIPNVEVQLSIEVQGQLKQVILKMPKISKEIENQFKYFGQDHLDFEKYIPEDYEHLNMLSTFQKKLLEPPTIRSQLEEDAADQHQVQLKINDIKSLRMFDIKQLDTFKCSKLQEPGWISLIKGIKNYCTITNTLLLQCEKDQKLQWIIYVTIWEHFSQKLSNLSKKYSFQKINQAFDEHFHTNLRPSLKVEMFGAKIWGGQVSIDKQFAINQILLGRKERKSDLPLSRIATVLMEMSTDVYNLQFAGSDEFVIPNIIQQLQEQSKQLYEEKFKGDYHDFFQFWFLDNQYVLTIFPEWIVENYVDTILFDFVEDLFCQQILKLTQEEQQQLNNTYFKEYQIQPIFLDANELGLDFEQSLQNLLTFDQFLKSQQEPTISAIAKRVSNEKKNSELLKSNSTTNYSGLLVDHQMVMQQLNQPQIGEQVSSDIQSEGRSSYFSSALMSKNSQLISLSLNEFEQITNQYDTIKFPIQSRIEARNQRIKMKNKNITKINYEFRSLFSFENQKGDTMKKQQDFFQSLSKQENKLESVIQQKECIKSIAEMLLKE